MELTVDTLVMIPAFLDCIGGGVGNGVPPTSDPTFTGEPGLLAEQDKIRGCVRVGRSKNRGAR